MAVESYGRLSLECSTAQHTVILFLFLRISLRRWELNIIFVQYIGDDQHEKLSKSYSHPALRTQRRVPSPFSSSSSAFPLIDGL